MNYLIQRGKVRSQIINVPEGFPELLSDITREVLRCQPTTECLCQFIIDYLHSLITIREKTMAAKSIIDRALRTVDEVIADLCICDISQEKVESMSLAMELCFKNFLEKRRCDRRKGRELIQFNADEILDDMISKCKFTEEELKSMRPLIEDGFMRFLEVYRRVSEDAEGTEALYQHFQDRAEQRMEYEQQNLAAVRIQASFRGFIVRKQMFLSSMQRELSADIIDPEMDAKMNEAARKIQQFYRKHHSSAVIQQAPPPVEECEPSSDISLTAKRKEDDPFAPKENEEKSPQALSPTTSGHDLVRSTELSPQSSKTARVSLVLPTEEETLAVAEPATDKPMAPLAAVPTPEKDAGPIAGESEAAEEPTGDVAEAAPPE